MDVETIKRINRDALRAAQEAESSVSLDNRQLMKYAVAVAIAVLAYYLMQHYQPDFVMVVKNGRREFDQMRAVVGAVVVGLLVLLGFHLVQK